MVYSHIWDGLLKLASLFTVVILLMAVHLHEHLEGMGISDGTATFFFVVIAIAVWIPVYRQVLSTLAAWLYANVNLGARISLSEARGLAKLVQLDLSMKWIPLKEVRRLPKAERRNAVLRATDNLSAARKAMLI